MKQRLVLLTLCLLLTAVFLPGQIFANDPVNSQDLCLETNSNCEWEVVSIEYVCRDNDTYEIKTERRKCGTTVETKTTERFYLAGQCPYVVPDLKK